MRRTWKSAGTGLIVNTIIGLLFVTVTAFTIVLVNDQMRQQALREAEQKERILLDHNLAIHTYFTHDLKPALFALTAPLVDDDYFDPIWMSSTYAVRAIDQYFDELHAEPYYYQEAAVNARSPQNEADALEQAFLEELNADPSVVSESLIRTVDGELAFVTLRRGETMTASCLRCHSTPDQAPVGLVDIYGPERSFQRQESDTVSAISIRIPLEDAYAAADALTLKLSGLLLIMLAGLFTVQVVLYRRLLLNPLARLRHMAQRIADNERFLGETIPMPGGRELRDLTAAFNTMSANLRQSRDRLAAHAADLVDANERLRQLSQVKDEFVANISHELRTPITNMKVYHHLLAERPENSNEYLDVLRREVGRLERLVEDLLILTRLDRGETVPRMQPVDLHGLLKTHLEDRRLIAQTQGLTLTLQASAPEDSAMALADPALLEQVISTLLSNAIHYTPGGGRVEARLHRRQAAGQSWIGFSIVDDGPGIPEAEMPHIFDRFFRGAAAASAGTPGTGLGLTIAHEIVSRHGGTIEVRNTLPPDHGVTVTVWLPAADPPAGEGERLHH